MYILAPNQTVEKYPYSIGELRRDNPNTSFPRTTDDALLAEWNVFPVQITEYPQVGHTKNVAEGTPVFQGGEWIQVWNITDASADEIAQREATYRQTNKEYAEQLLQQTDWTQIADVDLVNKADFTAYRAEVRAIALNPPVTVAQWPTKPEEIWSTEAE
jgi:hypothetical protein